MSALHKLGRDFRSIFDYFALPFFHLSTIDFAYKKVKSTKGAKKNKNNNRVKSMKKKNRFVVDKKEKENKLPKTKIPLKYPNQIPINFLIS